MWDKTGKFLEVWGTGIFYKTVFRQSEFRKRAGKQTLLIPAEKAVFGKQLFQIINLFKKTKTAVTAINYKGKIPSLRQIFFFLSVCFFQHPFGPVSFHRVPKLAHKGNKNPVISQIISNITKLDSRKRSFFSLLKNPANIPFFPYYFLFRKAFSHRIQIVLLFPFFFFWKVRLCRLWLPSGHGIPVFSHV